MPLVHLFAPQKICLKRVSVLDGSYPHVPRAVPATTPLPEREPEKTESFRIHERVRPVEHDFARIRSLFMRCAAGSIKRGKGVQSKSGLMIECISNQVIFPWLERVIRAKITFGLR